MLTGFAEIVRATSSTIAPEGKAKLVLIVCLARAGECSLVFKVLVFCFTLSI